MSTRCSRRGERCPRREHVCTPVEACSLRSCCNKQLPWVQGEGSEKDREARGSMKEAAVGARGEKHANIPMYMKAWVHCWHHTVRPQLSSCQQHRLYWLDQASGYTSGGAHACGAGLICHEHQTALQGGTAWSAARVSGPRQDCQKLCYWCTPLNLA